MRYWWLVPILSLLIVSFVHAQRLFAQGGPGVGVPSGFAGGGKVPADFDTLQKGITAATAGGQTPATQLLATISQVDTVTPSSASVRLLLCTHPPMRMRVINNGANSLQVFGSGTDTINGIATGTGVSQATTTSVDYVCTSASPGGTWFK